MDKTTIVAMGITEIFWISSVSPREHVDSRWWINLFKQLIFPEKEPCNSLRIPYPAATCKDKVILIQSVLWIHDKLIAHLFCMKCIMPLTFIYGFGYKLSIEYTMLFHHLVVLLFYYTHVNVYFCSWPIHCRSIIRVFCIFLYFFPGQNTNLTSALQLSEWDKYLLKLKFCSCE